MITFLKKYAENFLSSQNGEDGILRECMNRGLSVFHCVEIGGHDGRYCSNTAFLIESDTAVVTGTFVETDFNLYSQCKSNWAHNPLVKCICSHVDGQNINAFVDDKCDVLSIDVDGGDYQIFEGLKAKPKIVIVEIDSSIPPDSDELNSDGACGYGPMVRLGIEKGYRLLCHTGNLIFVDGKFKHLFPEILGTHPIVDSELYFNRGWMKVA